MCNLTIFSRYSFAFFLLGKKPVWDFDIKFSGNLSFQQQAIPSVPCLRSPSIMSSSLRPHDYSPSGSSVHGDGFSRQEYWSGLPCPPPGDLSNPGMEPRSPTLQVDFLQSEPPGKPLHLLLVSNNIQQKCEGNCIEYSKPDTIQNETPFPFQIIPPKITNCCLIH